MQILIFLSILIGEFLTTPNTLLFYDQIEYLRIVSTHGFWQVFSLGHFPIHPFFLPIFWITSRLTIPNYTAFISGIVSGIMIYKISKLIFRNKDFWIPALIFLLFPGIWLINTNLMVQSVMLPFFLFSIYFFLVRKPICFLISNFISIGIHIDSTYWLCSILLLPILFKEEIKFTENDLKKFIKLLILSIILSAVVYAAIYLFIRQDFAGSAEQILTYSSFGLVRIIRNIWVCFINNFGSLTPFLLVILLIKRTWNKREITAWLILFLLMSLGGAYWAGDLMMRRIVFAGVFLSFAIYKYLGKKSLIFLLFLLPITGLNAALYNKNSTPKLILMQQEIDKLPKDQILISSHYYYPFIRYDGKILWFETDGVNRVDEYLKEGKRVFMIKESVTAPYLLVVGNNYHITSLNRVGNSEARNLFGKYKVDLYQNAFEIKSFSDDISEDAGEPVIFYGQRFSERLSRMRINYGDLGLWIWSVFSGHKDATGFTYKDASGAWVSPEIGI